MNDDDLRWLLAESVDLARLRAFVVVAAEGSFTRAADVLLVAQPWVSTQVRELEARVGVQLLDRTGTQVVPTDAGARLLPVAKVLLRRAAAAAETARGEAGDPGVILRIGAPTYTWDVPARRVILERLAAEHPGQPVAIVHGESRHLADAVRRGEVDAAFVVLPLDEHGLDVCVVDESGLWMHVPVGHPLAARAALAPADLAGQRVGVWDRRVNPTVFELLYGPLRDAGAVLEPLPGVRLEGTREEAIRRGLLTLDRAAFGGRPRAHPEAVALPLELPRSLVTALVARADADAWPEALTALWTVARGVAHP